MFLRHSEELVHHSGELGHLDDAVLVGVVDEDLQNVPVQLNTLGTGGVGHGSLDEVLELVHVAMVDDGVRVHGGSLGRDVLLAKLQPLVEGDDTSGLEIHGVEHLLSGRVLLSLALVQLTVLGSITIGPGHGSSSVNQLGEALLAHQTILVGVGVHEQLQERVVHLRVRVALLVIDGLLHEPDKVFLGLVEGVHWARHLEDNRSGIHYTD